jgi:hypothetical protein
MTSGTPAIILLKILPRNGLKGENVLMPLQTSGGLGLPKYQRNDRQKRWVASERRTANLIQSLWNAAGQKQRDDPAFLCLLVQCGWNTGGRKRGGDATRRWRNNKIADYLRVPYGSDQQLAHDLVSRFGSLSLSGCLSIVKERTGITQYYTAYHPATLKFIKRHSSQIALAFRQVSIRSGDVYDKIRSVATLIESHGDISAGGHHISPFNGLTPVLSCLDPQCKFPIMNVRTRALLERIEKKADKEGAVALSKLIGPDHNIRDNRELDVYANTEKFPKLKTQALRTNSAEGFKDIGLKSEINSMAQIAAKKTTIKKLHNKLVNDLIECILWRQKPLKESRFDVLLVGWKKGRDLLIEAKTASEGPTGRSQVRQAIGQLYDYRFTYLPNNNVDLAVLLRKEPSVHVQKLLASLGIELLWFKGKALKGTIQL